MTQAELVADLVRRAGAASERLAELRTDVKDAALRQAADALEDACASILRANAQDLEAGRARGLDAPLLDRLTLDAGAGLGHGRRPARGRRAARPGRRDHPHVEPAERPAGRAHAHPAGRDPGDLRVAAQRDRGRRGAVPEDRQRGDPARRLRGACTRTARIAEVLRDALRRAGVLEDAVQLVPQTPSASSSTSCSRATTRSTW